MNFVPLTGGKIRFPGSEVWNWADGPEVAYLASALGLIWNILHFYKDTYSQVSS